MYPQQAITLYGELNGSGSSLIYDDGNSTVLGFTVSGVNETLSSGSNTKILCGSQTISQNLSASKYFFTPLSFPCENSINIQNSSGGNVAFSVTIVPFLYPTSTATSTEIATSSDISVIGTMSAGEVMITILLFIILMIQFIKTISQSLRTVNKKRKQIAYSGGDVDINDIP